MIKETSVIDLNKKDYGDHKLVFGSDPGLLDTINIQYPQIMENFLTQKSLEWMHNEFDFSSCIADFKRADKSTYDMMIKTLAWQWSADSVAATAIAPVLAPFITSTELWAAWLNVTNMEVIHGFTYSEIVRNSFDDPSEIMDEIQKVQEAQDRLHTTIRVFRDTKEASHKYALGMISREEAYKHFIRYLVALYCMERIQFAASFAITFAICKTGMFAPIGTSVQKIAQDELECHTELDRIVSLLLKEDSEAAGLIEEVKDDLQAIVEEVVDSELEWVDYLFSEGRQLVGITAESIKQWTLFCAKEIFTVYELDSSKYKLPEKNPLKYMEDWLNINAIQTALQEAESGAYKMGVLENDDEGEIFDVDF